MAVPTFEGLVLQHLRREGGAQQILRFGLPLRPIDPGRGLPLSRDRLIGGTAGILLGHLLRLHPRAKPGRKVELHDVDAIQHQINGG